jgi:hypothetical protein
LSLNWPTKLRPTKKTPPSSFPNHLLESVWVKSTFPYALSPCHEETMWDTIGVVRKTNAKLPHCMGFALAYPMENEMPHVHHAVEWWRCNYTNEDDKGPSGRTRGHLMLKTKSKLMQWSGVREDIGLRWLERFGLDELDVWQNTNDELTLN